jgi:ADP-heptose:LPS heptosyltransferase
MIMKKNKVLIIRFSSFGDIVQCSSVVELICQRYPEAQIDWVTRSEFKELVSLNKNINTLISLDRKMGFKGLLNLAIQIKNTNYDLIYDAHNNLRSNFIFLFLTLTFSKKKWISRSKDRLKRILLFKFKLNYFPKPFKGIDSFYAPLLDIGFKPLRTNQLVQYVFPPIVEEKVEALLKNDNAKKIITFVPSAAWEMKRWPIEYWKELATLLSNQQIFILGGKEDTFCEEIREVAPGKIVNLAGKLSLIESSYFIKRSDVVISADTGLLHVADVLGIKAISLMGPTAFGFTKSSLIETLETDLLCRPCSKDGSGKCSQSVYKKCMIDIKPVQVLKSIEAKL